MKSTWENFKENRKLEQFVLRKGGKVCRKCGEEYNQNELDQNNICEGCRSDS